MRLLLLLVTVALAVGVEKHHRHSEKHRGNTFLEVAHKAKHHNQHHVFRNEPCYPPPCPGYEYDLSEGQLTEPNGGGGSGGNGQGGTNNGGGGGSDPSGTGDNGGPNGGGSGSNGDGESPLGGGTGSNGEQPETPLAPDTPLPDGASSGGGSSGAAGGASGGLAPSSSSVSYWIQIVHPPPDPKAGKSDLEAGGCCNPQLEADRKKMLELQKKIDAQTEVRAGHIKWMQDALDSIAKVQRQILTTNETVYELTQDISLLEQQIDQIQKKIRADILKQNLEAAQDELNKIKENQSSIDSEKDKIQAKADALIEKQNDIVKEIKKIPHQNVELVAFKYAPPEE